MLVGPDIPSGGLLGGGASSLSLSEPNTARKDNTSCVRSSSICSPLSDCAIVQYVPARLG